jgi:hypothetical protein
MAKKHKPRLVQRLDEGVRSLTSRRLEKIARRVEKRNDRLLKRFLELHGKVVDFIDQSKEDGTLYISVRCRDKTDFSLRCASKTFLASAEFCGVRVDNYNVIRKHFRPRKK